MENQLIVPTPVREYRPESSLEAYANNLELNLRVASMLLKSGMVPTHFKSQEAVLGAVLYGKELGLSPLTALQLIFIVNGKPSLAAAGIQAIILQNGGGVTDAGTTAQVCKLKLTRGNVTREFSYSLADAKTAGLLEKDNWKRMPNEMLYARTVSKGGRAMWADKLAGLYSREELLDGEGKELDANPYKAKSRSTTPKTVVKVVSQAPAAGEDNSAPIGTAKTEEKAPEASKADSTEEDLARADMFEAFKQTINREWEHTYHYDITAFTPAQRAEALPYLNNIGAMAYDAANTLWFSPIESKKLINCKVEA